MTSNCDPKRDDGDGPGTRPGPPVARERVQAGRTGGTPVGRKLLPAAFALTAFSMLACLVPSDPGLTPPGERELLGHTGPVQVVALSSDGRSLAAGGLDRTVRLWHMTRWDDALVTGPDILSHPSWVYATAFSPDGSLLAAAGHGFATIWSCRPACAARAEWAGGFIRAVAFSPDGRTLALASSDGTIPLLEVPSARERMTLRDPDEIVQAIAFSPDGKLLASGGGGRRVVLWDVARGVERRVLLPRARHPIPSVAFSPDGRWLAVLEGGGGAREILILDAEVGAIRARLSGYPLGILLAFAPDGRTLAVAGSNHSIRLFDPGTARLVAALDVRGACPRWLAFSPDGRGLAYLDDEFAVRVVDLASRRPDPA